MTNAIKIMLLSLMVVSVPKAQEHPIQRARTLQSLAVAAYGEKRYRESLDYLLQALSFRPDHPTMMYNISDLYAQLHEDQKSLEWLGKVASMGMVYRPERDSSFVRLWKREDFQAIVRQFNRNAQPVNAARAAFRLRERGLLTEGLAYDPVSETFFVGSVRKRKIMSVKNDRGEEMFSKEADGLMSVFGMKVDSARRYLWVCTAGIPQMEGYREGEARSGLAQYDLRSGMLNMLVLLDDTTRPHLLGDLTLLPSGDVIVTDSQSPIVYRLANGSKKLEVFVESDAFVNLQGIDYSPEHHALYVADYSRGIFRVDLETKRIELLPPLEGATLLGIDGLYVDAKGLAAIQNGVNPNRLIRLTLSSDGNRFTAWRVLEANHALFDEPTLGVFVSGEFYFIGNSQWSKGGNHAGDVPDSDFSEAVVLKLPF